VVAWQFESRFRKEIQGVEEKLGAEIATVRFFPLSKDFTVVIRVAC